MDDISESKRAVDLLTSRYSIIDFGGEVRYLKNSNFEELLTGEAVTITITTTVSPPGPLTCVTFALP